MGQLTVIVPMYNNRATIAECLASIRASSGVLFDLIVIDDGSTDGSAAIARLYADDLICLDKNAGRQNARNRGMAEAKGDVQVFIDSDVCIKPDTLLKIDLFFKGHPDVSAVTGMLSCCDQGQGFFTDYKNLYMHHTFSKVPQEVSFLYGSIFALRARIKDLVCFDREIAEDTSLGHMLAQAGHKVFLLKELEVTHLKKYTFFSFIANDFSVPFHWARIFWLSGGWKNIFKRGPVFAHASKEQVVSLFLAVAAPVFILTPVSLFSFFLWVVLNMGFIKFIFDRRGVFFAFRAALLTWADHIVMFSGVVAGSILLLKPQGSCKGYHG